MIDDNALVLIIGIGIGVLMSLQLGILIYAYRDLSKKFKELFASLGEGETNE